MLDWMEIFEKADIVSEDTEKITVSVVVDKDANEDMLPFGNQSSVFDEQTAEDWYDFGGTIEGIIDSLSDTTDVVFSKNPNCLSEYIIFYVYDENRNKKNYLISLRLSGRGQITNAGNNELRKVSNAAPDFLSRTVIINDKIYSSYTQAIQAVRRLLTGETE